MYRTVIIDNDSTSREVLAKIFEKYCPEIQFVGEADSVASGVDIIHEKMPDLVFLDIRMDDGTGFDLIDRLDKVNFRLIFVSAYSDYAIRAFKYSAFDYIVKPILPEDIVASLKRINHVPFLEGKERVNNLAQTLNGGVGDELTIALPELNGFSIVKIKDIIYCEGERNYSRVHFFNGETLLVSRTLMEFDHLLADHGFFRIHRSYLIQMNCVNRYLKSQGGMVELCNGSKLKISPKYKDVFLEQLLKIKL